MSQKLGRVDLLQATATSSYLGRTSTATGIRLGGVDLFTNSKTSCMWTAASTTQLWTTFAADASSILFLVISAVLVFVAAMLGIGFAVRKTKKHVTGKKF